MHEGNESMDDVERLLHELKRYVDYMLLFLLRNNRRFENLADFGRFLDAPRDTRQLTLAKALRKRKS